MNKHILTLIAALLTMSCASSQRSCPAYAYHNLAATYGNPHKKVYHYNSRGKKVYTRRR